MNELLMLILSLSVSGSLLAGLVYVSKHLFKKKLSKTVHYYIWIIVLLRLILPFSFEGSLMNELVKSEISQYISTVVIQPANPVEGPATSSIPNPVIDLGQGEARSFSLADAWSRLAIYFWLTVTILILASNLVGYIRFVRQLKKTNIPATDAEHTLLMNHTKRRVVLSRNHHVSTPLLIGMFRPSIIIPDMDYSEKQLRSMVLHELTHLRRFDLVVKWLTMLVVAVHWFNPLVYFIRKEINRACELACDEAVIKNFSSKEKQDYGETLIDVVAEQSFSIGLQATMCEQKETLKERLEGIMGYRRLPRRNILLSGALVLLVIFSALYLGAGTGFGTLGVFSRQDAPPELHISTEWNQAGKAQIGPYSWRIGADGWKLADTEHPVNFVYRQENTLSVTGGEQILIQLGREYDFNLEEISVYKGGQQVSVSLEIELVKGGFYLKAPGNPGEYIVVLDLDYIENGNALYGFLVWVDTAAYDLGSIARHRTPYVGDSSKVSALAGNLPTPDRFFKQQFIAIQASNQPYHLTVYYEPISEELSGIEPGKSAEFISETNALVAFAMIENLDSITFAFRPSVSREGLDTSKYLYEFSFQRSDFDKLYGELYKLGAELDKLEETIRSR